MLDPAAGAPSRVERMNKALSGALDCDDGRGPGFFRFVRERYDRLSALSLALLVSLCVTVGYSHRDLLDANGEMDWLLAFTWLAMAALLTWNVVPRRDLLLFAVGAAGGAVIEWWGTNTRLWSYFTAERPPLWILPAWPIAALSIDRLARLSERLLGEYEARRGRSIDPRPTKAAYYVCLPLFVVALVAFIRPSLDQLASRVVIGIVLVVTFVRAEPRRDLSLFGAGSLLGVFLEYWGTSRECWTYYTHQLPPPVAIFAHGFASIAFARGFDLVEALLGSVSQALAGSVDRST